MSIASVILILHSARKVLMFANVAGRSASGALGNDVCLGSAIDFELSRSCYFGSMAVALENGNQQNKDIRRPRTPPVKVCILEAKAGT